MFALTSWLQHVSPDEIFHKSAGTDVLGGLLLLWRVHSCGGRTRIGRHVRSRRLRRAKLKALPS
jgi:hypothetical protein